MFSAISTLTTLLFTFKLIIIIQCLNVTANHDFNKMQLIKRNSTLKSNNSLLYSALNNLNVNKRAKLITKLMKHKKRCHYTDKPELADSKEQDSDNASKTAYSFVKQQRVRDQNRHYLSHNSQSKNALLMDQIESEQLFVNIGDTINLTCNIDTKEIDWHFKDRNLTTTILSYGLQLQVAPQSAQYDMNDIRFGVDYEDHLKQQDNSLKMIKYKVSSDRQSTHMLTLHVQGNQDEGSYQCVDSKSEIPVKKTIRVILSECLCVFAVFSFK